jgi:hypothetical protein
MTHSALGAKPELFTDCSINITQLPIRLQQNFPLNLILTCFNNDSSAYGIASVHLGVEVLVWTETQSGVAVFRHLAVVNRPHTSSAIGRAENVIAWRRTVRLQLPRYIAYCPNVDNQYSVYVDNATIRVWIASVSESGYYVGLENARHLYRCVSVILKCQLPPSCANWFSFLEGFFLYRVPHFMQNSAFSFSIFFFDRPTDFTT